MVYFIKSQPAPLSLAIESLKMSGSYKLDDVLERLRNDFKNKCYICEYKEPVAINIEHLRPHRENIALKFSWNNLFWSCSHCNNTKLGQYDDIIDCTDVSQNIGSRLKYNFNPMPFENVLIAELDSIPATITTKNLLNDVYNGTTPLKKLESANLRNNLLKEIQIFNQLLCDYYLNSYTDDEKNYYKMKIIGHLNASANFTAFKRNIIVSKDEMMRDFGEFCV